MFFTTYHTTVGFLPTYVPAAFTFILPACTIKRTSGFSEFYFPNSFNATPTSQALLLMLHWHWTFTYRSLDAEDDVQVATTCWDRGVTDVKCGAMYKFVFSLRPSEICRGVRRKNDVSHFKSRISIMKAFWYEIQGSDTTGSNTIWLCCLEYGTSMNFTIWYVIPAPSTSLPLYVLIYVESLGDVSAKICIIYFMTVSCPLVSLNRLFIILHFKSITTWIPSKPLIGKMSRKRRTRRRRTCRCTHILPQEFIYLFYAYFQCKRVLETYASSQWNRVWLCIRLCKCEAATLVRNRALNYLQEADAETTKNQISHFIADEFFQLSALSWTVSPRWLTCI